jgi:hypothetical protein
MKKFPMKMENSFSKSEEVKSKFLSDGRLGDLTSKVDSWEATIKTACRANWKPLQKVPSSEQ